MQTDFIIVGQGLCGTWLSYYLIKGGASVVVIDAPRESLSASAAASGIINPITGKRLARQWMGEVVLPFAAESYRALGTELDTNLLEEIAIHTFFSNADEANFFEQKAQTTHEDLLGVNAHIEGAAFFNYHYGIGTIHPAMLVDTTALLSSFRAFLNQQNALREEFFDWSLPELSQEGVRYKDVTAAKIIDCSGAASAHSPFFNRLPFALNKGEAIIASIPGLPRNSIYKYATISIVPWPGEKFWIGSTFDWDFTDELPTESFRGKAEQVLRQWLKLPYTFHEHFTAIRPATVTRDAFAGLHPEYPQLGILNGMGSKGCSLAPFLGNNFAEHLLHNMPLIAQVDVGRYKQVLGGRPR